MFVAIQLIISNLTHALPSMNLSFIVNGQITTSKFHKVMQQQYQGEVGQTIIIYFKFLHDVVCHKLSKLANVSRIYSKNKSGTFLLRHGVELLYLLCLLTYFGITRFINFIRCLVNNGHKCIETKLGFIYQYQQGRCVRFI